MTTTLTRIRPDLFQTRTDSPFPGLTTHAFLWTGGANGNVLFYSLASDSDFDAIADLGGVADQYLSHLDEAGPMLGAIARRFGSRLHAPAADAAHITRHATIDVLLSARGVDRNGVEVIPTPGHSPGSMCYLVRGAAGETYLFTGDTIFPTGQGSWSTFLPPGRGDAEALRASIGLLGTLEPDLVIASAFGGPAALQEVDRDSWSRIVAQALDSVPPVSASTNR
ncbi:MBL fold metallo-hydrolase [Mycobacterium sp. IS-1496]|uniref:MBL fold metallo-hydrolase n=1 Tax=Mycobacterium sp. IS-1496 TaxID=1772284 RepID=UPI0007415051|nr:MBL fold metallo-hydrolase [Mycobacterium sp. IS-1496]KUI36953.1 MBL fold metallo-hydrolase [Mycobacterium sp. IS-1496]